RPIGMVEPPADAVFDVVDLVGRPPRSWRPPSTSASRRGPRPAAVAGLPFPGASPVYRRIRIPRGAERTRAAVALANERPGIQRESMLVFGFLPSRPWGLHPIAPVPPDP